MRNRLRVWVIVPKKARIELGRWMLNDSWGGVFPTRRLAAAHLALIEPAGLRGDLGIAYCTLELLTWPDRSGRA